MDPLELLYETQEDIPENFRDLYTERDGKWSLTNVKGLKSQEDIDKLNASLVKERNDHKDTKKKLKPFEGLDAEEAREKLDKYDELALAAENNPDADKLAEQVEKLADAKVATATAPLTRELEELRTENEENKGKILTFETKETSRVITDSVRKAALGIKVVDTALDDVLMLGEKVFEVKEDGSVLTKDSVGCTPGVAADIWLSEMQEKRPHWWPASTGGGGRGNTGGGGFANNPFSRDHWNLTEQGKAYTESSTKAEQMAKAAGTTIGGPMPAVPKAPAA